MTTGTAEPNIHATALDGKVAAVNKANTEAKRLHPLFVEAFRPFLGKKIITQSGLVAKAKGIPDALVPFKADGYRTPAIYRNQSNYSLSFTVKVCESANSWRGNYQSAHYAEQPTKYKTASATWRIDFQALGDTTNEQPIQ